MVIQAVNQAKLEQELLVVIPVLKTVELLVVTRLDLPDRKEDILALQLGQVDIQVDNQDFQARLR